MTKREECIEQARKWLEPTKEDKYQHASGIAAQRAAVATAWMLLADRSSPNPPATRMAPVIPTGKDRH